MNILTRHCKYYGCSWRRIIMKCSAKWSIREMVYLVMVNWTFDSGNLPLLYSLNMLEKRLINLMIVFRSRWKYQLEKRSVIMGKKHYHFLLRALSKKSMNIDWTSVYYISIISSSPTAHSLKSWFFRFHLSLPWWTLLVTIGIAVLPRISLDNIWRRRCVYEYTIHERMESGRVFWGRLIRHWETWHIDPYYIWILTLYIKEHKTSEMWRFLVWTITCLCSVPREERKRLMKRENKSLDQSVFMEECWNGRWSEDE